MTDLPYPEPTPETLALMARRRSCIAQYLTEPGPSDSELKQLLSLAARVPDHGKLSPWRFILLTRSDKDRFISLLEKLLDKEQCGSKEMAALKKLKIPPMSIAVISHITDCRIPAWEQELSAGAVCMNLLTAACAMGYGANWITGWYAYDPRATALLGLGENEKVAGYIQLGTIDAPLKERPRCEIKELVSRWQPPA